MFWDHHAKRKSGQSPVRLCQEFAPEAFVYYRDLGGVRGIGIAEDTPRRQKKLKAWRNSFLE